MWRWLFNRVFDQKKRYSRSCSEGLFALEPNLDDKILNFELFLQWDKTLLVLGERECILHEGGARG